MIWKDKDFFKRLLGAILMATCMVYFFLVTWVPIPKENQRFADVIIGFLIGSVVGTIINYYYGSSTPKKTTENDKTDI